MLFYIIPEIRYAIGLAEQLQEKIVLITSQKHPALSYLRQQGLEVWCAEEEGYDAPYHAHGLLLLPPVRKLIENCTPAERYLVTFKNSPPFTLQAKKLQAKIVMPSFKLNRFWEDKRRGLAELAKVGVVVKPDITATWLDLSYAQVAQELQCESLVVQKPFGMAGNSTFFVNDEMQWATLGKQIGENPLVKVTPFLSGESFTVNCLLLPNGEVKSSYPMLQLTGDMRFTRYPGGTCGIDMTGTRTFSAQFLKGLSAAMTDIGKALAKTKFWGWFGVDILISNGEFVVLEINPRFTASISLFSQAQYAAFGHSFWQEYFEGARKSWDAQKPLPYTSLLIRNTSTQDMTLAHSFESGVYKLDADKLVLMKKTVFLKDLERDSYVIVSKSANACIHPDGEIATVVAYGSATENGNANLHLAKVADLVKIALLK